MTEDTPMTKFTSPALLLIVNVMRSSSEEGDRTRPGPIVQADAPSQADLVIADPVALKRAAESI